MTLTDTVILSGIIAAFTLFAMVLAWGEYQTRSLNRNLGQKPADRSGANEPSHGAQSKLPAQRDERKVVAENTLEREIVQI